MRRSWLGHNSHSQRLQSYVWTSPFIGISHSVLSSMKFARTSIFLENSESESGGVWTTPLPCNLCFTGEPTGKNKVESMLSGGGSPRSVGWLTSKCLAVWFGFFGSFISAEVREGDECVRLMPVDCWPVWDDISPALLELIEFGWRWLRVEIGTFTSAEVREGDECVCLMPDDRWSVWEDISSAVLELV